MKIMKMNPYRRARHNEALEIIQGISVGTEVNYWRGLKQGKPTGNGKVTSISMQPNNYGVDVVWIEGCSGCVSISHIELALKAGLQ